MGAVGRARISGNYLLFGRGSSASIYFKSVVLFDLTTSTGTVLATAPGRGLIYPGNINGDWAVWHPCTSTRCYGWRHQISTDTTVKIPSSAKVVCTPTVNADGTAY